MNGVMLMEEAVLTALAAVRQRCLRSRREMVTQDSGVGGPHFCSAWGGSWMSYVARMRLYLCRDRQCSALVSVLCSSDCVWLMSVVKLPLHRCLGS